MAGTTSRDRLALGQGRLAFLIPLVRYYTILTERTQAIAGYRQGERLHRQRGLKPRVWHTKPVENGLRGTQNTFQRVLYTRHSPPATRRSGHAG